MCKFRPNSVRNKCEWRNHSSVIFRPHQYFTQNCNFHYDEHSVNYRKLLTHIQTLLERGLCLTLHCYTESYTVIGVEAVPVSCELLQNSDYNNQQPIVIKPLLQQNGKKGLIGNNVLLSNQLYNKIPMITFCLKSLLSQKAS